MVVRYVCRTTRSEFKNFRSDLHSNREGGVIGYGVGDNVIRFRDV